MINLPKTITTKFFLLLSMAGVLMLMMIVFVYLFTGKKARNTLSEKILERELAITSSGARSIESFIQLTGNSIILLAKTINPNSQEELQKHLDDFTENWDSPTLNGVIVTDKNGKMISVSSAYEIIMEPNTDLSDRDYFIWAQSAQPGEIFVGDPILPRLEREDKEHIVPLSTPIFIEEEFFGVLAVPISLSVITEQYLNPMEMMDGSEIYLISSEGVVLHSPRSELLGMNFIDHLKNNDPFLGAKFIADFAKEKINERKDGTIDIAYPTTSDNKLLTRMLVAYALIDCDGASWILAIGTPRAEAISFIAPFFINEIGAIAAGLLIFLFFIIIIATYVERNARLTNNNKNKDQILESSKPNQDT